jgi:hypothetical protein
VNIYIASASRKRHIASHYMRFAEGCGHTITHDWATEMAAKGDPKEGAKVSAADLRDSAHGDRIGVFDCQLLINIWDDAQAGGLIETGIAIGLGKFVWVCGESVHDVTWNIFWELPQVEQMSFQEMERRLRNGSTA